MISRDEMRKCNLYHRNPTADGSLSFPKDDASHKSQDDKNCFAMSLVSLGQSSFLFQRQLCADDMQFLIPFRELDFHQRLLQAL
jgi:hypothetical protein